MSKNNLINLLFLFGFVGCAGGTGTGNPYSATTDAVTIQSSAYDEATSKLSQKFSSQKTVTDFKFCVTKIKVVTSDNLTSPSFSQTLGLIDLSDQNTTITWGTANIPTDITISEINIEIHQDAEVCGVSYSTSYQGQTISKDLEFKFKFASPVHIEKGDTIELGIDKIAQAIESAKANGDFTDENIDSYMESIFGEGSEI